MEKIRDVANWPSNIRKCYLTFVSGLKDPNSLVYPLHSFLIHRIGWFLMASYCEENMPPTVPLYDSSPDASLVCMYKSKYFEGVCPPENPLSDPSSYVTFEPLSFVTWLGKNALVGVIDRVPRLAYLASCIIQPDDDREVEETLLATYPSMGICEMIDSKDEIFYIYAPIMRRDAISLNTLLENKRPPDNAHLWVYPIDRSKVITIEQLWSRC
jgi:hypothetical protein